MDARINLAIIMTSCERSAYKKDLHWRIVWLKEELGYSNKMIGTNLNVDKSELCMCASVPKSVWQEVCKSL